MPSTHTLLSGQGTCRSGFARQCPGRAWNASAGGTFWAAQALGPLPVPAGLLEMVPQPAPSCPRSPRLFSSDGLLEVTRKRVCYLALTSRRSSELVDDRRAQQVACPSESTGLQGGGGHGAHDPGASLPGTQPGTRRGTARTPSPSEDPGRIRARPPLSFCNTGRVG